VTWRHRRLTSRIKDPLWAGMFAASGTGIQLSSGPHDGRLLQQFVIRRGDGNYAASLYSDDGGETWTMGSLIGPGVDENKIVQLSDGSILFNSRARPFRLVARSTDGGASFQGLRPDSQLADPGNNGSIIRYPRSRALLFSNTEHTADRVNLTVKLSCDDGATWPFRRSVVSGAAAYSTMVILPDGDIGLLLERGNYRAISFTRFPVSAIGRC
jgi:sialidase-1